MNWFKSHQLIIVLLLGLFSSVSHATLEHDSYEQCQICVLQSTDDLILASPHNGYVAQQAENQYNNHLHSTFQTYQTALCYSIRAPPYSF